jgi:acyl dehydratase
VTVDRAHLGRRYGPYTFEVGREHVRSFVAAVGGGVPGHMLSSPPDRAHPLTWDEAAAAAGPHRGIVAPPGFATTFAMEPFARAISDDALALDVLRLVHGEQELEFLEPIRPGDVLSTTGEITRLDTRASLEIVEVTTTSVNQHGRTVVRGIWTAAIRG